MQHFSFKTPAILRGYQRAVSPMPKAHNSWLIAFFAFVLSYSAFAQQPMPITGSLQINSPYPATWSEYAATGASRMGLNLTLNDAEVGSMNVRLKLYIERNNTLIATSSDVVTGVPTLNLAPFITKQLGALDLNPYFRFENLQGFSTPQYQQPLEDGVYRISFQVVNAVTGQRLSDMIGQSMFITLNDPPQLTQPSQGEQIATTGSTLTFQWLSRATTALPLQYDWKVIEVPVGTTNVEALWATAPILYQATVTTNTIPRPVSDFSSSKTYAWRVQAKLTSGMSLFRNNGFSETFTFQMGSTCPAVTGLLLTPKASDVIAVSWTGATTYYNYRVAYRKYSTTTVWEWVEQPTTNAYFNLTGLEAATEYEVKVGGVCANGATGFSAPLRATTLALGQIEGLNCGQMPPLPAAGTPIASLAVGDVITAGDFLVTLTRVSGGSGNFSGEGWVKIPWMGSTKIKVVFSGIGVNTEKKLTTGFLQTAYDPSWGNILDGDAALQQIKDAIQILYDLILTSIDKDAAAINAMIDAMRDKLAKELPEDLKNRLNQALTDLEAAKKAYDDAKKAYNSATTQAGKDAALAAMKAAEQNFKNAQAQLDAINKEKDKFIDDVITILVKSIKDIRTTKYTDATITALKTALDTKEKMYDADLTTIEKSVLPQGQVQSALKDNQSGAILLNIEEVSVNTFGQMESRKQFKLAEREYNRAVLIKAFASETNKTDAYKLLSKYLDSKSESYVAFIMRKKKEGADETTLITATKLLLTDFIETFLNRELKQK